MLKRNVAEGSGRYKKIKSTPSAFVCRDWGQPNVVSRRIFETSNFRGTRQKTESTLQKDPFTPIKHYWKNTITYSFIHSVFCLTTGPKPPPKRCLHIVRSRHSSFKLEYPLLSLSSTSSFLRLLLRLLATSISPFIFSSIICFRRQFPRKM